MKKQAVLFTAKLFLTVLLAVLCSAILACAEELTDNPDAGFSGSQQVSGEVVSSDWGSSTITVNVGGSDEAGASEMTFRLAGNALVLRNGAGISLGDIEINDPVRIDYVKDAASGVPVAQKIEDISQANE